MGEVGFQRKLRKFKRVALDSMIFIYQFGKHPRFYPFVYYIFSLLNKKKLYVFTSLISLIETISFSELEVKPELIESYKNFFIKTENLETVNPNFEIADQAASLRRKYDLRTPDVIQLATAMISKAEVFITNDDRFRKIKELPILLLKDFV